MPRTRTVGEPAPFRIGPLPVFLIDDVCGDGKWPGCFFRRSGHVRVVDATFVADTGSVATPIPSEREQLIQRLMGERASCAAVVAGTFWFHGHGDSSAEFASGHISGDGASTDGGGSPWVGVFFVR